jgi:hypothetical protein
VFFNLLVPPMDIGYNVYMKKVYYQSNEIKTLKKSKLFVKYCVVCSSKFNTYNKIKKTCCAECLKKIAKPKKTGEFRNCLKCGIEFYSRLSEDRRGYKRKYCSKQCKRIYSDRPIGFFISSDGYWCLSNGKKLHREIYKKHFNIQLKKTDIIHHINENKLDNRIDNLQKVTRAEHNRIHFKKLI